MKRKRQLKYVAWFEKPICFYTKKDAVEYCKGQTVMISPMNKH